MNKPSLSETLSKVESLNNEERPFKYSVSGNQIIGNWKYLDAKWIAAFEVADVDKEYTLTVTLFESSSTFKIDETYNSNETSVSFNPKSGRLSAGKSMNLFKGKSASKKMGFSIGIPNQPQNETSLGGPTVKYNFQTSEIKKPIIDFLEKQGWRKQGFWKQLFG